MGIKGIIVVNPFLIPVESVNQAKRLQEEFNKLNVQVEIVSDGYIHSLLDGENIKNQLSNIDFAIYLDKDMYLSEILERLNVRLFNRHDAIRVCDDKAKTCIALAGKGFNIPKTMFGALCYSKDCKIDPQNADKIASKLGYPVIVKECFGSMGKGVYKADNKDQLLSIMESVKLKPHVYQEYIGAKSGVDVRIVVIGGKAVAYMERRNDQDFRSNVARGGEGVLVDLDKQFIDTAERIAKTLNLDYCGIDLLYGNNGEPIVCEVNSNAFFHGLEKTTGINVAKLYAEHVIRTIKDENK